MQLVHAACHRFAAPMSAAHPEFTGFGTRAIHAGQEPDPVTGAVCVPISLATTFAQQSPGVPTGKGSATSYGRGYEYSRTANPTRNAFEQCMAALENARFASAWASGLAAASALVHLLEAGDHIVSVDNVYGGTQCYFRRIVKPTYNMDCTFVDFNEDGALEAAMTPRTKLVWLESPTNPMLKISDIRATAEVAHRHGCLLAVDNTFMSPYFQNPLDLGADVVMHSATKYIGGHSDLVMGVIATNNAAIDAKLRFIQNGMGAVPAPFDCYMALRGLKTLHVRMREHAKNAQAVAEYLESHPAVERVMYPGLPSHPQHELACSQARGFGGMVTFYIKGGLDGARVFLESVRLFKLAASLGAVESLAESLGVMADESVSAELGISNSLVRLSVGIEDQEDILADLRQAMAKVAVVVGVSR